MNDRLPEISTVTGVDEKSALHHDSPTVTE